MPQFNATDAIFFGFRIVKRDPTLLIALAVLMSVVGVGGSLLTAQELAEFNVGSQAFATMDPDADPQAVLAEMFALLGGFFGSPKMLLYLLATVLASLVVQGAVLRSLVNDRREGWVMGMQLGADELRIFVVSLVVGLLIGVLYAALAIALGVIVGLLSVINQVLGGLAVFVGLCVLLLALALAGTRFSAATPASVGEGKFIVFGSWRITKGRMWGLLGAYVILAFIFLVAYMALFVLMSFAAPQAAGVAQGMTTITDVETAVAAYRSPAYNLILVLFAAFGVVSTAAWSGVGAYAYRMLGSAAGYANAHPPQDSPPPLVQ